jgi:hypothetical protein
VCTPPQAVKIMVMMCLVFGAMWALGLLPSQKDGAVLEARMRQMMAAQQQQQQQQAAATQGAAAVAGQQQQHGEL